MKRTRDISNWPVMQAQCSTCPFLKDERGRYREPELAAKVESRLLSTSQLCHHPRLHGKPETHLCRGARIWQLTIFYRLGVISEPTDQAWEAKRREIERSR
jgi:hypothetical protein